MLTYKNTENGEFIQTESELKGNWELFDPKEDEKVPTIPELQSLLTELGVEFDPKAKKSELLTLYEEHKGS